MGETTPPTSQQVASETPVHGHDSRAQLFAKTPEARKALIVELSRAPMLENDKFFLRLVPVPPNGLDTDADLEIVITYLTQGTKPTLTRTNVGYIWNAFSTAPENSPLNEDNTFKNLGELVRGVAAAATRHLKRTGRTAEQRFFYISNPHRTPVSTHRDSISRPDGYFLTHAPTADRPRWWDIGPVAEFKKGNTLEDRTDNLHKILWGLNHIMREDPCRRAAWGFTIENTTVHLWYCDRSQIISSKSFDFFENPKLFVKFLLSIIFADPSDLGWDPTIVRVEPPIDRAKDRVCQYEITVHDTITREPITYRTLDILFHAAADGILGRGTRVWSAYRTGTQATPENTLAVKDCWIDSDRMREGDIRRKIRETAQEKQDEDALKTLENHFPHIIAHGDVQGRHGLDTTPCAIHADETPASSDYIDLARSAEVSVSGTGATPSSHYSLSSYVDRFPRKNFRRGTMAHYRVVTQEVGHALHDEKSLRVAFRAIEGVTQALMVLHYCGWVHRDISSGNILVYEGRGLLTDFEYAKCLEPEQTDQTGHATRTGTKFFMSVEVDSGDYAFRVPSSEPLKAKPLAKNTMSDLRRRVEESVRSSHQGTSEYTTIPLVPFRYHPLNDWESLFWVSGYMLIDRLVDPATNAVAHPPAKVSLQRVLARSLFYDQMERRKVISPTVSGNPKSFHDKLMACLHEDLLPVGRLLDEIRTMLNMAYTKVEADLSSYPDANTSLLLMADGVVPIYLDICAHLEQPRIRDIAVTRIPPVDDSNFFNS